jgi:hypothetical protein
MANPLKSFAHLILVLLLGIGMIVNFDRCSYSFTGASVPGHLKTIAIPIAEDRSPAAIPGLREALTEDLIQKFIDDNSLQVTGRSTADAVLECSIINVVDAPTIVSAGEQITLRRITITVKVLYKDLIKKITILDKNFTNYGDYEPAGSTNDRLPAIETALDKISEDVLLAVVSGW